MKDEALCRLLISDPDTGMEKLILKNGGLVSAVISGRLRSYSFSKEDIEDCSAETFFEFWRGFEKDPCRGGEIRARLCVIAKRNAIDRLRSSYRSPETLSIDDEQGKLIWSAEMIEEATSSIAADSFRIAGRSRVFEYRFDESFALLESADTGEYAPFKK